MSVQYCKFYSINQTCRFGEHCRFSHSQSQRPPPRLERCSQDEDGITESKTTTLARPGFTFLNKDSIPTQDDSPPSSLNNRPSEKVCLFFASGWCRYGRNCKFSHNVSANRPKSGNKHKNVPSNYHSGTSRGSKPGDTQGSSNRPFSSPYGTRVRKSSIENGLNESHSQDSASILEAETQRFSPQRKEKNHGSEPFNLDLAVPNSVESSSLKAATDEGFRENARDYDLTHQKVPRPSIKHQQSKKLCAFYKAGKCKKGAHCKFSHGDYRQKSTWLSSVAQGVNSLTINPEKNVDENAIQVTDNSLEHPLPTSTKKIDTDTFKSENSQRYSNRRPAQRPSGPQLVYFLSELEACDQEKIRSSEIEAIKRRFPKDRITCNTDSEDGFLATIKFVPTDPDWPFDVTEFVIAIKVPPDYPKKPFKVTLSPEQELPNTVRRYVELSLQEWLQERQEQLNASGKVELMFRPFLRWLDKNIEEITTEALKQLKRELTARAAGFEFIPAKQLKAKYIAAEESSNDGVVGCSESEEEGQEGSDESEEDDDEDESASASSEEEEEAPSEMLDLQPQQRGTEVCLRNLQLKEAASAILFQRLVVVLTCGRCKMRQTVGVSAGSVTALCCEKCQNSMHITFRPGLAHAFSSVIGYLDMDGCSAFDVVLQDSRANVSCSKCTKQTTIDGLVTGQLIDGWCKACNGRFKLAAEAVKLSQLIPSGVDTSSSPVVKVGPLRPRKPPRDPAIREGQPLPGFGTCKHYRQSYRWLRFPCCGKAYPCDVCHDKAEDHPHELATRMICGHCCREQNYSATRPCVSCSQHMTKTRTAHWEGGSGCRDKLAMSKGDNQKYKSMNKTISRKKAESKSKKKNTKLRHA